MVAWVVLVAAVVGRVAVASPRSATVVPIYLKAGERWLAGENVYAGAWPLDVYRNPPGVAAFFAPWSLLPEKTAGVLWRLLGVAVYLAGLAAWVRHRPEPLGPFAVVAAVLVIPSFNNGQVNVLLVGCLLHAAANVERDRLWRAAAWVAFASFFKVYPLAVGLLFCVVKPRLALRLVPAVAAAAVLPFLCQSPGYVLDMHRTFVAFVELEGRYREILDRPAWDWTMIPRAWLDVRVPAAATQLASAVAGLALAACVWLARRRAADPAAFALAVGCVWMTLFGPATENATYTLVAPVVAALFLPAPVRAWAFGVVFLFTLPILRGLFPGGDVLPMRTAQPTAAILFLVLLVRSLAVPPSPPRVEAWRLAARPEAVPCPSSN